MSELEIEFLNWIEITPMSARLKNSLRRFHQIHPGVIVSEIKKETFCDMPFVGNKQWYELQRKLVDSGIVSECEISKI